jgi:peroxiredoxin
MPGFNKLYTSRSKDGLVILGVNEDTTRADMEKYLAERPVSFPILIDQKNELMNKLGVRALPTTILIADGKVAGVYEGVNEYMEFLVEGLLKAPTPAAP